MAAAIESLLKPEAKPVRRRCSFHRRYRKRILIARILLAAAVAIGLFAVPRFAYTAFNTANCYRDTSDASGNVEQVAVESVECADVLASSEDQLRLDASTALLGAAFLLSSVVCYRKARRHRPRAPIRPVRQH